MVTGMHQASRGRDLLRRLAEAEEDVAGQDIRQIGVTIADASVASATGSSETIAALSTTRNVLNVYNNAVTTWWINESGGTAAANGAGCFELPPGARWTPRPAPRNAVTGIGTAAAKLSVKVA